MKKLVATTLLSGVITSMLFAHGENSQDKNTQMMKKEKKSQRKNDHTGDHMHNGKMMNHKNPNGMTDKEMQRMKHNN